MTTAFMTEWIWKKKHWTFWLPAFKSQVFFAWCLEEQKNSSMKIGLFLLKKKIVNFWFTSEISFQCFQTLSFFFYCLFKYECVDLKSCSIWLLPINVLMHQGPAFTLPRFSMSKQLMRIGSVNKMQMINCFVILPDRKWEEMPSFFLDGMELSLHVQRCVSSLLSMPLSSSSETPPVLFPF